MQITIEIKCPTCLSDSIKKNGIKVDGKQNYQCKDCKRQFIGDHALSYLGCNSGITRKILQLMVRGSGIRDIAEKAFTDRFVQQSPFWIANGNIDIP